MAPREFEYDARILDPTIRDHIARFYEAADTTDHEHWASFFSPDARLKKGAAVANGADGELSVYSNIIRLNYVRVVSLHSDVDRTRV